MLSLTCASSHDVGVWDLWRTQQGHIFRWPKPSSVMFVETVVSEEPVSREHGRELQPRLHADFCKQDEITMFTEKGWSYSFTAQDSTRHRILFNGLSSDQLRRPEPSGQLADKLGA